MNIEKSKELFERAVKVIPGGVNSPVRAFAPVGGQPRFITKAKGSCLYDEDGNEYIDYIGSWGPMIIGHNDERVLAAVQEQITNGLSYGAVTAVEVEMAELITEIVPCIEMVRMVNSGTEAVMSAIRVARGFTKRNKIVKFEGCYHGHADALLVKAGSGLMTAGTPGSAGVPEGCVKDTLTATYNDLESVEQLFKENPDEIACVIVEPVAANMGVVTPKEGFLQGLRDMCTKNGTLLIFDEVITGFRLKLDGASGYFGITPDLVTYGKIIGGGMPVGAYGGRREVMETVAPIGNVYQAGTLSGNPVAMRAGITQLQILRDNPDIYDRLEKNGEFFRAQLREILSRHNLPYKVNGIGSLTCLYFAEDEVVDYKSAQKSDTAAYADYFRFMIDRGNYLGPSQFEACFLSDAHTEAQIKKTLADIEEYFG